ncbi:MAG: glycosyltransferase family 2 protein [Planctomycetota bacterium]
MTPELSVLIVNYNSWNECAAAVQSLRQNPPTRPDGTPMPYECIVVDNRSPQQPPAAIENLRHALAEVGRDHDDPSCGQLILHDDNAGYSKGVNLCFRRSRGRWILVSNPDLLFPKGCISALQRHLEQHPDVGCVVPKGYWDEQFDGKLPPNTLPTLRDLVRCAFGEFCRPLRRRYHRRLVKDWLRIWEADRPIELRMMSGCLFLVERDYFEALGLMDERFPLYYEDADLSVRIVRSGKKLVQVPDAKLVHFVNRSGQTDLGTMMSRHDISRDLYFRKWYGALGGKLNEWVNRLMRSKFGQRHVRVPPDSEFVDLGSSDQPPRLQFRRCDRYLLLVSLDSRFHLAGGLVGSGDHWTPTAGVYANFSATTYWCRVYDISGGRLEVLGTWRYDCRRHLGTSLEPAPRDVGVAGASK